MHVQFLLQLLFNAVVSILLLCSQLISTVPLLSILHGVTCLQSDVNVPGLSTKLQAMLHTWFSSTEKRQVVTPPVPLPTLNKAEIDWEGVIDARIAALKSKLELQANTEVSGLVH